MRRAQRREEMCNDDENAGVPEVEDIFDLESVVSA